MSASTPGTHDPAAEQEAIIDEFSLFPEWLDRYQYLIDLGRKLPLMPEADMIDANLLQGCQSRVWLVLEGDAACVTIRAASDAAIVSGLIALLVRVYSGASAATIRDTEPFFIDAIGLSKHLSPTRATGLHAMLTAIRGHAIALAG
ncbi:SufE family protein [Marinihelvus fidelis]|uniref:SufE family protein n=1 Tax=Marinihelvus fidelis TaxID=2613842 RepID=A0A5N0TAU0_9GAMM|nr:SufE family protein [Marinihelvus fidelis]KAA9132092.1 SufE family protein [Marinihelvus fidelis]